MAKQNPEEDPKKLKAKIRELEKMVETQNALIKILRSMPMSREVGIGKSKPERNVPIDLEKEDRPLPKKGSKRKSEKSS